MSKNGKGAANAAEDTKVQVFTQNEPVSMQGNINPSEGNSINRPIINNQKKKRNNVLNSNSNLNVDSAVVPIIIATTPMSLNSGGVGAAVANPDISGSGKGGNLQKPHRLIDRQMSKSQDQIAV